MVLAEFIVGRAQVFVREDLIGFTYGLEFLVCGWVVRVFVCRSAQCKLRQVMLWNDRAHCVGMTPPKDTSHDHGLMMLHTWVVDHGHLAIGLFDLKVRRGWLDAQDIVIRRVDHHDE